MLRSPRTQQNIGTKHLIPVTNALEVALHSLSYKGTHCPHGFRASASTLLNAERIKIDGNEVPRFSEQAVEFQLEHVDSSIAAKYNRDQRLPEREKIMQHWADRIDEMRDKKEKAARAKVKAIA
jgi:hypothetical protein